MLNGAPRSAASRYLVEELEILRGAQNDKETSEPLAKCSRRLQPALAQAGKPVPP
jgi:hypothetical protein